MSARECLLVGACIGAVLSGFVFAYVAPATVSSSPEQGSPLPKDRVRVLLEGEFTLHHQDCALLSVWTKPNDEWVLYTKTYECGRGTIPSNPLPPDGGPSADWEWEEYGLR